MLVNLQGEQIALLNEFENLINTNIREVFISKLKVLFFSGECMFQCCCFFRLKFTFSKLKKKYYLRYLIL